MKTLNRTLSLVLVLVMVLAFFGVAGAAYTDDADITYVEAVDVTSAIGVFNGIDNEFQPTGNLTREQAAKIICYLTMGQAAADKLTASADPFTDVAADRWSAGSIAYCVQQGIIAGRGDGTFDPTANVTGFEFAKMLLVALGYDAAIEQFTGPSWALNVSKRGFQNDLFVGYDAFNGNDAANREEAALYVLNTLLAGIVTYDTKGTNITMADGSTVVIGASAPKQNSGTFMRNYYNTLKVNNGTTRADLGQGTDDYGRASNNWTFKGVSVGKYATEATITYTADMCSTNGKAQVAKDLKGFSYRTGAKIVENGKDGATLTSSFVAEIAAVTGNGTLVEVAVDSNNAQQINGVTVIKTDLAKVSAVSTKSVTLTTASANPVMATYTIKSTDDLFDDVKGLAVGDFVLVTPIWVSGTTYAADAIAIPEQVAGVITNTATNPNAGASGLNSITINGKAYAESAAKASSVDSATPDAKLSATLWLDSYGYAVNVKAATVSSKDFLYVAKAYSTIVDGEIVHMAKGYLTDGTAVDVATDIQASDGSLYVVSGTPNDVYTLGTPYAFNADAPAGPTSGNAQQAAAKTVFKLTPNGTINAYDKALTSSTNGTSPHYYNNYYSPDVVFIYADTANKTATVKNGVQEVSKITQYSKAIVEADDDGNNVVTAVILMNDVSTTVASDSLLFFPSKNPVSTQVLADKDGKTANYDVYVAYKNGEQVLVPTKSAVAISGTNWDGSDDASYVPSYFSFAMSDTVTGAYVLATAPFATSSTISTYIGMVTSSFSDTLITMYDGATSPLADIDITGAKIVDVRTDAAQDAYPVTLTAKGICDAVKNNLTVSVVYNADTGKASLVYVCARGAGFTIIAQSSNVTFWLDSACTASQITTGTTKVAAGTTVYVKATDVNKTPASATYTVTPVTTASGTVNGVVSFVMPVGGVTSATAFTES